MASSNPAIKASPAPDPLVLDAQSVNKIYPGDAVDAGWPESLPPYLVSIRSSVLGDSTRKSARVVELWSLYNVKVSSGFSDVSADKDLSVLKKVSGRSADLDRKRPRAANFPFNA
ncbi:hypothetical protein Tco_1550226 [Tanacetum coccineum]